MRTYSKRETPLSLHLSSPSIGSADAGGTISFRAKRDIEVGEELLYAYTASVLNAQLQQYAFTWPTIRVEMKRSLEMESLLDVLKPTLQYTWYNKVR